MIPSRLRRTIPLFVIVIFGLVVPACAEWNEKVLYSFQGIPDGATPAGGVALGSDGSLYGATTDGGADNCPGIAQCGTVFQLKPPAQEGGTWTETVLYVFKGRTANDGSTPAGGVILDKQGNIYGTTGYGGSGDCVLLGTTTGCGTVWELSPPKEKEGKWTEKIVYSFKSAKNGWLPQGDLTFDAAGNLYGATEFGGSEGTSCNGLFGGQCGTVFELSPPAKSGGRWTEKVLHNFAGGKDGAAPNGGLAFSSAGGLLGTTVSGGSAGCKSNDAAGCGIAFELISVGTSTGMWEEKIVHRFQGGSKDAAHPNGDLIFDGKGNFYGTSLAGPGSGDDGTVFEFSSKGGSEWVESFVYVFQNCGGAFGCLPAAGLTFDASGNLYGMTTGVLQMTPPARDDGEWTLDLLYKFKGAPDGQSPNSIVLKGEAEILGTTLYGGGGQACQGGCGTIFEVTP
jgi:uncharacterized repeat protein (TIGR03803 family)